MKKFGFFGLGAILALFASCGTPRSPLPDPALVEAVSAGELSRHEPITVVFLHKASGAEAGLELTVSPFTISPSVTGKAVWRDERTLDFQPSAGLTPNTLYQVAVDPSVLGFDNAPFGFQVRTPKPELLVEPGLLMRRGEGYSLEISVLSADVEKGEDILKAVRVYRNTTELPLEITEGPSRRHLITLDGLLPGSDDEELTVVWNSAALGGSSSGSSEILMPAEGRFQFLGFRLDPAGALLLSFSEPLDTAQDLRGTVRVEGTQVSARASGGVLQVFSHEPWPEAVAFTVEPTLKSIENRNLGTIAQGTAQAGRRVPSVEWSTRGVIIPPDAQAVLPVKTVNLRGLVVEAIQIFDDNVTQFLQVNRLDGQRELIRVGRPVWRNAVTLSWVDGDLNREKDHLLDLRPLIQKFPDGMFHIRVSFLPNQVVYPISGAFDLSGVTVETIFPRLVSGEDESFWDFWAEDFSWEEINRHQNNPSHPVFYRRTHEHDISINRNVLVSHIGLVAKRGEDRMIHVWSSDLRTTVPIGGVNLRIFDFQGQTLAQGNTDGQGAFNWRAGDIPPAFVAAVHQGRRSWLRVDEGSALSISHFDVRGDRVERGLKGFLYGERGVWRPGDTLFLTFILLDTHRTLPANHPVVLELIDPNGSRFTRAVLTEGRDGFYHFPVVTNPESPTGNWMAVATAGGKRFSLPLMVETVIPNRLRSELTLGRTLASGSQTFQMTGAWLHGAPASNLQASIALNLFPRETLFTGFSEFTFDDPLRRFSFSETELWKGTLDAQGQTQVRANFPQTNNAPGRLRANLRVRIFEPSGAFSVESVGADFDPYNSYLGIQVPPGDAARGMLLTDVDHRVRLVALNPQGVPSGNRRVRMELFELEWRWWWESGETGDADFEARGSRRAVQNEVINLTGGRGEWRLRVNYPEWGRYFIRATDLDSGHSTGRIFYIDWPNWAGRPAQGADGASMLVLAADKRFYAPGETATITFPSSTGGRALAVLEGGGRTLRGEWLTTAQGSTQWRFRIEAGMAPNVYAHVTLVQPFGQRANDSPMRLYGVIPVEIRDPGTRITPVISSADTFEPQSTVRVVISEQTGRPMTYTLALVDEGLLGLTAFQTPNPWDTFYRREASRLRSFDLYDFIAGAWAGRLQNLVSIGGAGEEVGDQASKLGRFPPVVRFIGPVTLNAGARNTHELELPLYVGAVRLMAVGASRGVAFGVAEKSVPVRKDLMAQGTLPRVMGPGEESDYPVTVFWGGSGATNVNVSVLVSGAGSIVGPPAQIVRFTQPGEQTVRFRMRATGLGALTARVTAMTGNIRSEHLIEMQTRVPTQAVFQVSGRTIAARQTHTETVTPFGVPGTGKITLEVSRLVPMDLGRRLAYLISYPYGCVEQLTSAVFPQVYLDKIMVLNDADRAEIQNNVTAAINRLRAYQNAHGGFSYWPGENSAHDWSTSFVGHFLLEAKQAGFFVPPEMLAQWVGYQVAVAQAFAQGGEFANQAQAYRLYTLARAGKPDIGAMNRLREERLDGASQMQLAVAFQLAGMTQPASALAARANLDVRDYKSTGDNFGSTLRDKAIILEALTEIGDLGRAGGLAREISTILTSDEAHGTQALSWALVALARFGMRAGNEGGLQGSFTWRGGSAIRFNHAEKPLLQFDLEPGTGPGQLLIVNGGAAPLHIRIVQEARPAPGDEPSVTQGIAAVIRYTDANGRALQPENLELGTDVLIRVDVRNLTPNRLENVALSWYAPAGWEISNPRMAGGTINQGVDYEDYRDDRVDSFFSLNSRQTRTLTFRATTAYGGRFYLPALFTGPMYDPAIQAVVPGRWVTVGAPPSPPRPR